MVTGILPVVGVPLPLVSYGGSSVVALLAGFGVLKSLHAHRSSWALKCADRSALALLALATMAIGWRSAAPHARPTPSPASRFRARSSRGSPRRWRGVTDSSAGRCSGCSAARAQPKIIDDMSRPAERVLQWWQYRQIFLTDKRISAGVEFWQEHRDSLERVSAEQGVPAQYIVAILGAETYYGRITGSYRVLDALATLAFDYPPRARYFRSELEQFLVLTHRERIDPLSAKGSYAGAMGPLQFMPSADLRYGVDGDDDGQRDLFNDWDDIFASVANICTSAAGRRRPGRGRCQDRSRCHFPDRPEQPHARRDDRSPECPRRARGERGAGRYAGGVAPGRAAGRPDLPGRLQQFPRAHPLQPQRPLRDGGR